MALTGCAPFETPAGSSLVKITGILYDRIQVAMDRAYSALKIRRAYDNPVRESLFAEKIRTWFGGKTCRGEWMTLQLKCISRKDKTLEHVDTKNCCTPNYDVTAAFCVMFYDTFGMLWSLKFLLNSRAAPGHYLKKEITYSRLIAVITSYLESLDTDYDTYLRACIQRPLVGKVTWQNFRDFFLFEHSPWEVLPAFKLSHIHVKLLAIRSAPTRNYWESAPVHRIRQAQFLSTTRSQVVGLMLPCLF